MGANGNSAGRRARRVVTTPTISSAAPEVKLALEEKGGIGAFTPDRH